MDDWITAFGIRSQLGEVLTTFAWYILSFALDTSFFACGDDLAPEDLLPAQGARGTVGAASSSRSTIGKAICICLSSCLSVYVCIYLSTYLPIYLSTSTYTCTCI